MMDYKVARNPKGEKEGLENSMHMASASVKNKRGRRIKRACVSGSHAGS